VRLTVLGAGPAYTDRDDAAGACYLVADGSTRLLLDVGHGAFQRIFRAARPTDVDAVYISHLHPDHFIDLVPMRHYLRYEFDPPRRLRVIAPRDLADRLDALHAEPGFAAAVFDTEPLDGDVRHVGSLNLRAVPVAHTEDSYAVRVTSARGGPGLVYSGDCGRADDLRSLLEPRDALLTEVSFGPGPVPEGVQHLDGRAVGRLAASAGVGRVLLTHLQMGYDPDETLAAVRAGFAGPVEFVWPGSELDV